MSTVASGDQLKAHHRRNAALHWANSALFHFGFTFIQPSFVVVAYVKHFTTNAVMLNFPTFLSSFALGIGPVLASMIRLHNQSRKRALIIASVIQRVMLVPMIAVTGLDGVSRFESLWIFLVSFAAYSMAWGFSYYFWQELVSRTLDPPRRTWVLGVRDAIAKAVDIAASILAVFVLRAYPFPRNYVACFLLTLISIVISLLFIVPMQEVRIGSERESSRRAYLASVIHLPRDDPDFRWFVVYIILSSGMLFIGGLYTSVTLDRFGVTHGGDSLAGVVKTIAGTSGILSATILGKLSDRYGRFWGFFPCAVGAVAAPTVAIFARDLFFLQMLVFVLRGVTMSKWYLEVSATLSFAQPQRQHRYIAYVGMVKLIPVLLFTNAGGVIANLFSPEATFAVAATFAIAATAVLAFVLKPRWDAALRRSTLNTV